MDSDISVPHKGHHKFYELKNTPGKIIRVETAGDLHALYNGRTDLAALTEFAVALYKELEDDYGVAVPATFFTGEDAIYSMVDKIAGKHLKETILSAEVVGRIRTLYASLAEYFLNKLAEGGRYLWDLNSQRQYIYGRTASGQEDKIYLIDTDLRISGSRAGLYLTVEWLTRHMAGMERHTGCSFEEARHNVSRFISHPFPDSLQGPEKKSVAENIAGIRKFLNNEELGTGPESAIPPIEL